MKKIVLAAAVAATSIGCAKQPAKNTTELNSETAQKSPFIQEVPAHLLEQPRLTLSDKILISVQPFRQKAINPIRYEDEATVGCFYEAPIEPKRGHQSVDLSKAELVEINGQPIDFYLSYEHVADHVNGRKADQYTFQERLARSQGPVLGRLLQPGVKSVAVDYLELLGRKHAGHMLDGIKQREQGLVEENYTEHAKGGLKVIEGWANAIGDQLFEMLLRPRQSTHDYYINTGIGHKEVKEGSVKLRARHEVVHFLLREAVARTAAMGEKKQTMWRNCPQKISLDELKSWE